MYSEREEGGICGLDVLAGMAVVPEGRHSVGPEGAFCIFLVAGVWVDETIFVADRAVLDLSRGMDCRGKLLSCGSGVLFVWLFRSYELLRLTLVFRCLS